MYKRWKSSGTAARKMHYYFQWKRIYHFKNYVFWSGGSLFSLHVRFSAQIFSDSFGCVAILIPFALHLHLRYFVSRSLSLCRCWSFCNSFHLWHLRKIICLFIRLLSATLASFFSLSSLIVRVLLLWTYASSFAHIPSSSAILSQSFCVFPFLSSIYSLFYFYCTFIACVFMCLISSLVAFLRFSAGWRFCIIFGVAKYFTFQCAYSIRVTQSCGFWLHSTVPVYGRDFLALQKRRSAQRLN